MALKLGDRIRAGMALVWAGYAGSNVGGIHVRGPSIPGARTVPSAPLNLVATAGDEEASVVFDAPASDGGSAITGYTVTSIPAGGTDDDAGETGLTHVVSGLTNGVEYTFTATATNAIGTSAASAASNAVTPEGAGGALPDLTALTIDYAPDGVEYEFANAWPASGFAIAEDLESIGLNFFLYVAGQCPPIVTLLALDRFDIDNLVLATGDAPAPPPNMTNDYNFSNCPLVTGYAGGDFPTNVGSVNMTGCAYTEAAIDAILAGLVAGGVSGIYIGLDGGTNASPSAAGLANIALLELDGCSVDHN